MSAALGHSAATLAMHRKRKSVNAVALTLSLSAMAFGLFWLIWILAETITLGIGGLSLSLFRQALLQRLPRGPVPSHA